MSIYNEIKIIILLKGLISENLYFTLKFIKMHTYK